VKKICVNCFLIFGLAFLGHCQNIQILPIDTIMLFLSRDAIISYASDSCLVFLDPNDDSAYLFNYSNHELKKYSLSITKNGQTYEVAPKGKERITYLTYFEKGNAFLYSKNSKYFWFDLISHETSVICPRKSSGNFYFSDSTVSLWDWDYHVVKHVKLSQNKNIIRKKKYRYSLPIPTKALFTTWYPAHYFAPLNDTLLVMVYYFSPTLFVFNLNQRCWTNTISIPVPQIQNDSISPFGLTYYYQHPYKNFFFQSYRRNQYWAPQPFQEKNIRYFQLIWCSNLESSVYNLLEDESFTKVGYQFILYDKFFNPLFISEKKENYHFVITNGILGEMYFDNEKQKHVIIRYRVHSG
jgi:hypothetical protein